MAIAADFWLKSDGGGIGQAVLRSGFHGREAQP